MNKFKHYSGIIVWVDMFHTVTGFKSLKSSDIFVMGYFEWEKTKLSKGNQPVIPCKHLTI